jgi:hypothetical protein
MAHRLRIKGSKLRGVELQEALDVLQEQPAAGIAKQGQAPGKDVVPHRYPGGRQPTDRVRGNRAGNGTHQGFGCPARVEQVTIRCGPGPDRSDEVVVAGHGEHGPG